MENKMYEKIGLFLELLEGLETEIALQKAKELLQEVQKEYEKKKQDYKERAEKQWETKKKTQKKKPTEKEISKEVVSIVPTKEEEIKEDKSEYGNKDINECLDLIKKYNNGVLNGSDKQERRFGKHLISKLSKIDSVQKGEYTRQSVLKIILEIVSKDKFYSPKISSAESIYYNLGTLMQVCKNTTQKQKNTLTPI